MHRKAEIETPATEMAHAALYGEIVAVSPDVKVVTLRPRSGPDVEAHLSEETNIKIAWHVGARALAAGTMREGGEANAMDADVFVLLPEKEPTGIFQGLSQPGSTSAAVNSMLERLLPRREAGPEATDEEMDRMLAEGI